MKQMLIFLGIVSILLAIIGAYEKSKKSEIAVTHGRPDSDAAATFNAMRTTVMGQMQRALSTRAEFDAAIAAAGKYDSVADDEFKGLLQRLKKAKSGLASSASASASVLERHEAKSFNAPQICRAAIATVMGRDPLGIDLDRTESNIHYLSYIRADDRKKFRYRCKIEGQSVIWATEEGRWRNLPEDGVIIHSTDCTGLKIEEMHADKSKTTNIFSSAQLR